MAIQRTEFTLITGINRAGDPPNTIVPSAPRQIPKAADLGGAQARLTFDTLPPSAAQWGIILEGTNMVVDGSDPNNPTIDPLAVWVPASVSSVPITSASSSPTSRMVDGVDQTIKLLPFVFVRASWVSLTPEATEASATNYEAQVFCKLDYITG